MQVELQNPCREGKKLLVLDIDYTLFDHRSTAENPLQLMRPCIVPSCYYFIYLSFVIMVVIAVCKCKCCVFLFSADLHEFLTAVYSEYDIMIWSATRYDHLLSLTNFFYVLNNRFAILDIVKNCCHMWLMQLQPQSWSNVANAAPVAAAEHQSS